MLFSLLMNSINKAAMGTNPFMTLKEITER